MRRTLCLLMIAALLCGGVSAQHKRAPRKRVEKPPDFSKYIVKDEWVKIASGKLGEYYYNPVKMSRTSTSTNKIWIKEMPKPSREAD